MKATLRKLTSLMGTLLLMAALFTTLAVVSLAASEETPKTGETTVTWESGFVRNTASDTMAEGSLQASDAFSRTELIYVSSADVTISWWAPYWYGDTLQYVSIRDAEDDYVSCGMAGTGKASSVSETRNGVTGCIYSYTTTSECYLRISVYANRTGFTSTMNEYAATLTYTLGGNATENAFVCPANEIPENPALDTSKAEDLTAEQLAMLNEAVARYGITDQETFDVLCEVAATFAYEGIAARVQKGVGIRSLYTVNHNGLAALGADRVTYGAIMGIGKGNGVTYNTTSGMTVKADAENGYVANDERAKAVVVYDSEGAAFATNKYVEKAANGDRTFAYTTMFGEDSYTPEFLRDTELVYRGFIAITVGDSTYILYADASGDIFGMEEATYGAATSVLEVSDYFRNTYTDPDTSEKVYATNVRLKENIAAAMDTEFIFTANDFATSEDDGSVAAGESTYYAAEKDGEGNVAFAETLVVKTGESNKLTLTVNAAREGFYRVAMKGNTLGSQIHYIYWKNTSLKTNIKQFKNGTRLAANGTCAQITLRRLTAIGQAFMLCRIASA